MPAGEIRVRTREPDHLRQASNERQALGAGSSGVRATPPAAWATFVWQKDEALSLDSP
jgi:hypothetical protein